MMVGPFVLEADDGDGVVVNVPQRGAGIHACHVLSNPGPISKTRALGPLSAKKLTSHVVKHLDPPPHAKRTEN